MLYNSLINMAIFQRDKSFLYEHFFPPGLTKTIAQHVFEICNDIGLVPCTENLKKDSTLISKLNRAWCLFRGELKPNPRKTKKVFDLMTGIDKMQELIKSKQ